MTYRRADKVMTEVIDGRAMIVDPKGAEMLTLNPVGTFIWEALNEPADEPTLIDRVRDRFPAAEPAQVATDVARFLAELAGAGLVVDATD